MKLVAQNLSARLTPALPFPLERGERILLEQGMHRFGEVWLLFALPGLLCVGCYMPLGLLATWLNPAGRSSDPLWLTTLIMVLLMLGYTTFLLWPWLLSGRYWLTTRRLIWRPHLGRARQVPLDALQSAAIRAFAWTQTLQVRGEQTVRVRFTAGLAQLWGGLLLLQTPGVARALEEPPAAEGPAASVVLIPHATCTSAPGRSGMAVLAGDFVAFIPAELRDDSVEVAVEMVFSFLPYSAPGAIRPELPLETVLPRLVALPLERCALHLRYLAAQHAGVYWQNESATHIEAHIVGRARALALRFTVGEVTLSVTVAPSQKPDVERLLAHWQPDDVQATDSRCG